MPLPTDFGTSRRLEHAIVRHHGHDRLDIMAVPCVGVGVEESDGNLVEGVWHGRCLRGVGGKVIVRVDLMVLGSQCVNPLGNGALHPHV